MNVKFGEMSILIPNIANLEGHSGILGTHLFYIPEFDTTIVANFGSSEDIDSSYEMLYWILSELQSINTIHQKSNNQELKL
jgi:D-alanyl-D-alanine carboxypeptidase